jgi:hypothetical protein
MSELRDAALYYARWRGWAVFPLKPRAKEPLVAGAYKAATAELEQVEAWWRQWPDANIGLATGERSGVWVLDIDGPEGFASFDALELEHGEVPDTQWASTGKGSHLFWQCPAGHDPGRRIGVRPGLDLIGGSGYLVLPPSIHPNGREYVWADADTVIPVAPDWLRGLEKPKPVSTRASTVFAVAPRLGTPQTGPVQDPASYLRGVARAASRSVAGAAQGTRNHELFKQTAWICSVAAALNLDEGPALRDVWQAARLVGLEEREIERTLQSAMEKGRSNPAQGLR